MLVVNRILFIVSVLGLLCVGAYGDGTGWDCTGEDDGCAGVSCRSPSGGYSCASITDVSYDKCGYVGESSKTCTGGEEVVCAKQSYYAGGSCQGNPGSCNGTSLDITDEITDDDGC